MESKERGFLFLRGCPCRDVSARVPRRRRTRWCLQGQRVLRGAWALSGSGLGGRTGDANPSAVQTPECFPAKESAALHRTESAALHCSECNRSAMTVSSLPCSFLQLLDMDVKTSNLSRELTAGGAGFS